MFTTELILCYAAYMIIVPTAYPSMVANLMRKMLAFKTLYFSDYCWDEFSLYTHYLDGVLHFGNAYSVFAYFLVDD